MKKIIKIKLPKKIEKFMKLKSSDCIKYGIKYNGWYFEAGSIKAVINQMLKYVIEYK